MRFGTTVFSKLSKSFLNLSTGFFMPIQKPFKKCKISNLPSLTDSTAAECVSCANNDRDLATQCVCQGIEFQRLPQCFLDSAPDPFGLEIDVRQFEFSKDNLDLPQAFTISFNTPFKSIPKIALALQEIVTVNQNKRSSTTFNQDITGFQLIVSLITQNGFTLNYLNTDSIIIKSFRI
jgi:hypothetical protein